MTIHRQIKGFAAETRLIRMLQDRGHDILEHRYVSKLGEIDIISQKDLSIYFFEVKYRKEPVCIEKVISDRQIARLRSAINEYIDLYCRDGSLQYMLFLSLISEKRLKFIPIS